MSEEKVTRESHDFEPRDLSASSVLGFLGALVIVGVLAYFVLAGLYGFLDRYQKAHEPPQNPLVQATNLDTRHPTVQDEKKFPLPRLETNERGPLNDQRQQEEETLHTYGWLDQKAGIARIPIERAMQLIVERGLPIAPQHADVPGNKRKTDARKTKLEMRGKQEPPRAEQP